MRNRLVAASAALLAIATIGLAGCSSDTASAKGAAPVQGPGVGASSTGPMRVDAAAFADVIATPGVQIIDVRTPGEFAEGHIEGAVNVDVQGPDFVGQISQLDPSGTYAVYCRSGNRSQPAVAAMVDAGLTGITELESGIVGWQGAGLPVVR